MDDSFDYVIVGAGTAGCLLADRLSESGAHTVCVIEAGPKDLHPYIHLPAGYIRMLFNPAYTWRFQTEPSEGSGGRSLITLWCGPSVPARIPRSRSRLTT